jgi:trimethylamine:corrinoid methyltransferase-like protein
MALLDEEQMEALHRTSMRILSELGIRVMGNNALDLFDGRRRHRRSRRPGRAHRREHRP